MAAEAGALDVGHNSAGSDCVGKVFNMGSKGLLAGGFFGTVEGCFLPTVPVSQPIFMRTVTLILGRSVLGGFAGGLFAASACLSASYRDKDDYVNATVGGAMAGGVFGIAARSLPIGLGVAVGLATMFGAIKYMHGDYLPPLPSRKATLQAPDYAFQRPHQQK